MTHPSRDQLLQFLAEELRPEDRGWIEGHVNACEKCLEQLEVLQPPRPADLRILADLLLHPPLESASRNGDARPQRSAEAALPAWPCFAGYEILARVGGGGMGEVYQARHLRTGRVVALKTVTQGLLGDGPEHAERLARFGAEAEVVSRLQHPNIVQIYDVGEQHGRPYFTMEWVSGGSLAERLAGRPVAEHLAAQCIATLARALHHVHQCGIVHRDLKPGNVLLSTKDVPKVADFGVAKLLGRTDTPTRPHQLLGTPEYMAPEQAAGANEVGPAADVYALGVLLYEQLTGRPPFKAHDPLETLRQVRDNDPLSPRHLRPGLDHDLETICLACLRKDPLGRYCSAQALADDLERWLTGQVIRARPVAAWGRVIKWSRRHPERAALVGLSMVLVMALVAGFFWRLWSGNAEYARQLASAAEHQLLLVRYAVGQTAQEVRLRRFLAAQPQDQTMLRTFLIDTKQEFMRWFTRPGEEPPIINWFVMDTSGTILADSYEDPRSVGKNYAFRDYYRGLMRSQAVPDRTAVYISSVYHSEQDERCKFTVITRVWDGDQAVGLLGASIATGSRMVALDMARELPGAAIVGPMDRTPRPGNEEMAEDQPRYIVLLRRDCATPGSGPVAVDPARLPVLTALAAGAEVDYTAERFSATGCMVNFARIGDSPFVVIVQQPYPWPMNLLLRPPWLWTLAGIVVLAGLWSVARRHRPRPHRVSM
jgi:serine/threonine-protein kinase